MYGRMFLPDRTVPASGWTDRILEIAEHPPSPCRPRRHPKRSGPCQLQDCSPWHRCRKHRAESETGRIHPPIRVDRQSYLCSRWPYPGNASLGGPSLVPVRPRPYRLQTRRWSYVIAARWPRFPTDWQHLRTDYPSDAARQPNGSPYRPVVQCGNLPELFAADAAGSRLPRKRARLWYRQSTGPQLRCPLAPKWYGESPSQWLSGRKIPRERPPGLLCKDAPAIADPAATTGRWHPLR